MTRSIIFILLAASSIAAGVYLSLRSDNARGKAWVAYQQCVLREYKTTPQRWYETYGALPSCEI